MPLTDDQKGHLRQVQLNVWEIKFLEYLKQCTDCRTDFRFDAVPLNVQNAIWALSYKQLISIERRTELLQQHISIIRLTDQGKAILEALEEISVKR